MKKKTPGAGAYMKARIGTIGHLKVVETAKKLGGSSTHVALSGAGYPLTVSQKKAHAEALFKHPVETHHNNIVHFLSNMSKEHDHFTLVCGSDRANEYKALLKRYNGNKDKSGKVPFSFKSWKVHEVEGKRVDSDKHPGRMSHDELVASVSATKLERLAKNNNWEHFKAYHPGMPKAHVKRLFDQIRNGMNIREDCVPKLGLANERENMPQIDNTPKFLKFVEKNQVKFEKKKVDTEELRASQADFDIDKVFDLVLNDSEKPIITSVDGYVLDGHHRWLAKHDKKIDSYVVDLPILDLLRLAKEYCATLKEGLSNFDRDGLLNEFLKFLYSQLEIKTPPVVKITDKVKGSFACYCPADHSISIVTKDRHFLDVARSVAHEMIHHKQNLEGRIKDAAKEGETGSEIENEANAQAGILLRNWVKLHPEHFSLSHITENVAIFVVGGPCSGKNKIIDQLKEEFEFPEIDIQSVQKAKTIPGNVIINGSADRFDEISMTKDLLESNGYHCSLIFVTVDNDISKLRNESRKSKGQRVLSEAVRFSKYCQAEENREKLQKKFKHDYQTVNNSFQNKAENREEGTDSVVKIYREMTPGQAIKEAVQKIKKKKLQVKSPPREDLNDPASPYTQDTPGVGITTAGGSMKPYGLAESVQKWIEKPETVARFRAKYGQDFDKMLRETAEILDSAFSKNQIRSTPRSLGQIRESADKGALDSMGMIPVQNKDESEPNDGGLVIKKRIRKPKINK